MADGGKEPSAKDVAFAAMAQGEIARTQSYLQRGRRFKDLDDEALSHRWVQDMRAWSQSIREKPPTLDDADAEYKLRRQEAPYHLVTAELEAIVAAAAKVHEAMSQEDRARANADMLSEYEADQRSRN